jgi:hypothetical protein
MSYNETEYNDFVSLSEQLWATDAVNLYAPILSVSGQKDGISQPYDIIVDGKVVLSGYDEISLTTYGDY